MKRTLLFLFTLIAIQTQISAQGIQVYDNFGSQIITNDTLTFWYPDNPNVDEGPLDFEAKDFARVVNASSDTMIILLERRAITFINGSEDYACWGAGCYGGYNPATTPVTVIPDDVKVAPMDTAGGTPLVLYFDANNNTGEAVYRYRWYNQENPTDSASIYVKWVVTTLTQLNDIAEAAQNMEVYPNPATDHFTVDLNTGIEIDNQEIVLRDMLGKIVSRQTIASHQEKFIFSTEGLRGGVYFVSYSVDGEILKTNKLVIR